MPTDPRDDQYQVDQYQVNHDSRFDNNPEFDAHRTSTRYDDPSLITTDSAAKPGEATGASDQPDLMGLAGVEPDEDDLLGQEDRLDLSDGSGEGRTPKTRSIATAGPSRTVAVAGVLGVIVLFTVAFMGLFGGGGEQVAEEAEPEEDREEELFSESDAYRSRLALVDQQRAREEQGEVVEPSDPIEEEPEEEDPEPEPTQASSPPPPQDSTPPPQQSAPPPPAPQQSAPPPPAPQQSAPEPDPFEQWNVLAQAGTQGDSFDLVEPVEEAQAEPDPGSAEAALANGGSGSQGGQGNGSRNGIPVATIGSFGGLGGGAPSSSSSSSSSNAPAATASAQPNQPAQTSTALSSGAQGILDRGSQGRGGQLQEMEVLLGSTVRGRLTVPIVASQSGDTLGRFAVELVEPLHDSQGNTALPAGTTLITEVQAIDNNTLAIQQSVVAVIYEDSQGQVRQETLTPDTLIIRGGDGGALIARQEGGGGAGGGNLLTIGAASALAEAGRALNADDLVQTTSSTAGPDSSTTSTTTVRESGANVLGAALEGFFGTTTERLQADAEAAAERDQTEPVLVVEDGRDLQVFVNGFLTVRR